jgi:hypothetical protein
VAGSTWEEDEEEMDHYANSHPEIRFILAPHEISEDRLAEVERLFRHSVFGLGGRGRGAYSRLGGERRGWGGQAVKAGRGGRSRMCC